MPKSGEHKTVQARILEYTEAIGWTIVSREEAEQRRLVWPGPRHTVHSLVNCRLLHGTMNAAGRSQELEVCK